MCRAQQLDVVLRALMNGPPDLRLRRRRSTSRSVDIYRRCARSRLALRRMRINESRPVHDRILGTPRHDNRGVYRAPHDLALAEVAYDPRLARRQRVSNVVALRRDLELRRPWRVLHRNARRPWRTAYTGMRWLRCPLARLLARDAWRGRVVWSLCGSETEVCGDLALGFVFAAAVLAFTVRVVEGGIGEEPEDVWGEFVRRAEPLDGVASCAMDTVSAPVAEVTPTFMKTLEGGFVVRGGETYQTSTCHVSGSPLVLYCGRTSGTRPASPLARNSHAVELPLHVRTQAR